MSKPEIKKVKVLFKYHSSILDKDVVETMWADIVDAKKSVFKLDNIPFYGPPIAREDIFIAEYNGLEKKLVYHRTIESSGNSIVLVVVLKEGLNKELIRNTFHDLNCESEGVGANYFSMEVKKDTNYATIKDILEKLEKGKVISYAEPCLSTKHKKDLLEE
ncbi:hypothetical protein NBRC110019_02180 [Neptunitalea chrysea]|uniref:DUF4265 domain-containing protein n=1 Tax=Neptunitalea chrysea TaxID=1647581 RepID=A0A9W6B4K8_9FLAO|nr:DUF4265 domain-containing protein [Neptunitalea chrysea]GLB51179.1 hypothetical protein NBRC110019_02180 [Neptunitalea chrysea]